MAHFLSSIFCLNFLRKASAANAPLAVAFTRAFFAALWSLEMLLRGKGQMRLVVMESRLLYNLASSEVSPIKLVSSYDLKIF